MSNHTFFAVQVAYREYPKDETRKRLHDLVVAGQTEQSLPEKRAFWKQVVALVNEHADSFEYATWEFIRGTKAEPEFETWSSEIEGGLATETEELGSAPDEAHRLSAAVGDARFVFVTTIFLVDGDSNTDTLLGERCDVAEADYWKHATLLRLLASIPLMNFANVRADAVYIAPGSRRDGISELELREGWSHLRPVER